MHQYPLGYKITRKPSPNTICKNMLKIFRQYQVLVSVHIKKYKKHFLNWSRTELVQIILFQTIKTFKVLNKKNLAI
jgi:hypothetical protein